MLRGALAPVLARVGQLPNFFHQNFPPSSFSTSLVNIVVIARFIKMITKISCTNSVARVLDCVHEYVRNASFISFCVSYYLTRDVPLSTKMDDLNDQMDDQSLGTKLCVKFYTVCKAVFCVPIGKFYSWLKNFTQPAVVLFVTNRRCVKVNLLAKWMITGLHKLWYPGYGHVE